ncbi:MAG: hypothetical protein V1735_04040 [Nanoarchaeota archaeon]
MNKAFFLITFLFLSTNFVNGYFIDSSSCLVESLPGCVWQETLYDLNAGDGNSSHGKILLSGGLSYLCRNIGGCGSIPYMDSCVNSTGWGSGCYISAYFNESNITYHEIFSYGEENSSISCHGYNYSSCKLDSLSTDLPPEKNKGWTWDFNILCNRLEDFSIVLCYHTGISDCNTTISAGSKQKLSSFFPLECNEIIANESSARLAIDEAFSLSNISEIYSDQQISIKLSNGSQQYRKWDRVGKWGNQTWAINYISQFDSSSNLLNISPIFFEAEMTLMTYDDIVQQVTEIINSTKK